MPDPAGAAHPDQGAAPAGEGPPDLHAHSRSEFDLDHEPAHGPDGRGCVLAALYVLCLGVAACVLAIVESL